MEVELDDERNARNAKVAQEYQIVRVASGYPILKSTLVENGPVL